MPTNPERLWLSDRIQQGIKEVFAREGITGELVIEGPTGKVVGWLGKPSEADVSIVVTIGPLVRAARSTTMEAR